MQDLGLYNNNQELMTEDDFGKTSLQTGKIAMEKLMQPVEATWEGRGVRRGGVCICCFSRHAPPSSASAGAAAGRFMAEGRLGYMQEG